MHDKDKDRILIDKSSFNSLESFFNEAKRIFVSCNTDVSAPATDDDIKNFEKKFKVKLSDELKLYFKTINGVSGYECLSTLIPIQDLNKISVHDWFENDDEYKMPEYDDKFILGDVMINSHQWALILNSEGITESIIEMNYESTVAKSISEFLVVFLNDSPYAHVGSEDERNSN
jgi:cell wall assembly regulator SMI1